MTPQADLGSSCAEAKILRHINDALTTARAVHDMKRPLNWNDCVPGKSSRDFSLQPGGDYYPRLDDSLRPVTDRVCGMRPGAIFTLPIHLCTPLTCLVLWFGAGQQPMRGATPQRLNKNESAQ